MFSRLNAGSWVIAIAVTCVGALTFSNPAKAATVNLLPTGTGSVLDTSSPGATSQAFTGFTLVAQVLTGTGAGPVGVTTTLASQALTITLDAGITNGLGRIDVGPFTAVPTTGNIDIFGNGAGILFARAVSSTGSTGAGLTSLGAVPAGAWTRTLSFASFSDIVAFSVQGSTTSQMTIDGFNIVSPIPEKSSLAYMLAGLAALGGIVYRRRAGKNGENNRQA